MVEILGILVIIIGGILFLVFARRESKKAENPQPSVHSISDRLFKLAELKRAEVGKYNWDDSGCVFEVNEDGSVTIIGHFDPAELLINPQQELYDKLVENGFFEMLPKLWGVYDHENDELGYKKFWLSYNGGVSFIAPDSYLLEYLKTSRLNAYNPNEGDNPLVSVILKGTKNTIIFLLPMNEKEFILCLGAQACIRRFWGNDIAVRISSPTTMGAFWIGVSSNNQKPTVSFAFGEAYDYKCCNMNGGDGLYEVMGLLSESVIRPLPLMNSLDMIAHGCYLQACILNQA